jgi:hypothetical protein
MKLKLVPSTITSSSSSTRSLASVLCDCSNYYHNASSCYDQRYRHRRHSMNNIKIVASKNKKQQQQVPFSSYWLVNSLVLISIINTNCVSEWLLIRVLLILNQQLLLLLLPESHLMPNKTFASSRCGRYLLPYHQTFPPPPPPPPPL